ncbi:MAG: hypothetical protein PVG66_16965, partial [Chromatiales bacterium]
SCGSFSTRVLMLAYDRIKSLIFAYLTGACTQQTLKSAPGFSECSARSYFVPLLEEAKKSPVKPGFS